MGKLYKIPCKFDLYVKGDLYAWREYDWSALIDRHFPGTTNDFTLVCLALDPFDPYTWEAPAEEVALKRELYEARMRVRQLTRRHDSYVQQDGITASFQEDVQ